MSKNEDKFNEILDSIEDCYKSFMNTDVGAVDKYAKMRKLVALYDLDCCYRDHLDEGEPCPHCGDAYYIVDQKPAENNKTIAKVMLETFVFLNEALSWDDPVRRNKAKNRIKYIKNWIKRETGVSL